MLMLGISPTDYTVSTVLVACSQLEAVGLGEQMHCLCMKYGFLDNVVVGTALVKMYWKCYNVDDSCRVFDDLPNKNVVTWTSMITVKNNISCNAIIAGFATLGNGDEALNLFIEMRNVGYAQHGYANEAVEMVHENKEIGVRLARKFVGRFPHDPAAYVQLSYSLATGGYWDDSA
ncbi:hypothetical protein M8C21_024449, partial [Ambrosia artemisiifolia]